MSEIKQKKCGCGKSKTGFCDGSHAIKEEKTTISLAGTTTIDPNKLYLIDFSKLNSVNDLVLILAAMSIAFPGDHPHIDALKPFLNTNNPMDIPGREPKPVQANLNLPKLKTLN